MRLTVFCLLSFAIGGASFCQNDSLKSVVRSNPDQSVLFEATDLLVKRLAFKEPDSALYFGFKVFEAVLENDTSIAASISLNLGTAYYAKGDYENALIYWQKAADLSRLTPEKQVEPLALNNVAIIYQNTGRIQDAIQNFAKAIDIYEERKDTIRVGRGTFNIGKAHLALGEDSIGVYYINQSIDIYSSLGEKALKNLANAYNELATVFYYDSEYPSALENYQRSIRVYLEAGDTLGSLKPQGNIGNIHRNLGNSEEALATYRAIIATKEKFDQFNVHFNYHNLGEVYADLEDHEKALVNYRKALSLRRKAGLIGFTNSTLIGIAQSFKQLDMLDSAGQYYSSIYKNAQELDDAEHRASSICAYCEWLFFQGKEQESLPYLKECYEEANSINAKNLVVNASNWLQQVYELTGDYEKAHKYLKISSQLSDSLFNTDVIREIAEKEAAFENEKELIKRENSIKLLESKKQVADLRITLLLIGLILIVVTAFLFSRMMIMKKERKKKELEAISKFRESMTGMIAHDLKTPLSIIMNSSKGDDSSKKMAGQMLQLINNMLDVHRFESTQVNIELRQFSLAEIIDEARSQVEFLLLEKNLSLKVESDKDFLVSVDKSLVLRVFVNLLTNAIKYSPLNDSITIHCKEKNDFVHVMVSDNGEGIAENKRKKIFESFEQLDPQDSGGVASTGLGLTFVKLALNALDSDVRVDSQVGEGTTFSFDLPLIEDSEKSLESLVYAETHFSDEAKKVIGKRMNALRELDLYRVGEIENELANLKGKNGEVDIWVEEILKSVYAGNKERYEKLLNDLS